MHRVPDSITALLGVSLLASTHAQAGMLGWTASVRAAEGGGFFVDVFAVTNDGDALLNVYGGFPGSSLVGWVSTTASGGFVQSTEAALQSWKPGATQGWNSRDSFLTIGGGFNAETGAWRGNASTNGDPQWLVGSVDTFSTAGSGNSSNVPFTAGWYATASGSPARSLASLGNRAASSSAAAAAGTHGMLAAHLFIADAAPSVVLWSMSASVRRADGTISQEQGDLTIQVPTPGALALVGLAGWAACARRRA